MRRHLHLVLIGLGAFLVVSALLMRFYAYPTLAVAPIDQNSVTEVEASDATLLDTSTFSNITTDLEVKARTVGDVTASEEAGDDVRVWVTTTSIRSDDGQVRSRSVERAAFDAVSGEAINCCDGFREVTEGERTEVERSGLVFKFPFDTQKKDYALWEASINDAVTAEFSKVENLDGLEVYVFDVTIPTTLITTRDVPASLFDLEQDEPVEAEVYYESTKQLYVEPNTGAIIDRVDAQKQWLEYEGDQVITTEADLAYTDKQVADNIDDFGTLGPLLGNLKGLYALLAGLIGVALILGGVVLRSRHHSGRA